jgi:hypothetical protein
VVARENQRTKHVKSLKNAKLKDPEDASECNNKEHLREVINKQTKVTGQQVCVTNFVHKHWRVLTQQLHGART